MENKYILLEEQLRKRKDVLKKIDKIKEKNEELLLELEVIEDTITQLNQ